MLYFSACSFALVGLGELEAFMEFYETLLEEFHATPHEGFTGPSVEDLRKTEMGALKQAIRLMHSSNCPVEDAIHTTVPGFVTRKIVLRSRPILCKMYSCNFNCKVKSGLLQRGLTPRRQETRGAEGGRSGPTKTPSLTLTAAEVGTNQLGNLRHPRVMTLGYPFV